MQGTAKIKTSESFVCMEQTASMLCLCILHFSVAARQQSTRRKAKRLPCRLKMKGTLMNRTRRTMLVALMVLMLAATMALVGCAGAGNNKSASSTSGAGTSADNSKEATSGTEAQGSGDTESAGTSSSEDKDASAPKTYQAGMPVTLSAYGKTFFVESYEITTADDGNTVVVLYSTDFVMGNDWRDNMDKYLCFGAECVAGGTTYPTTKITVQNNTAYKFEFAGKITPESITVYPLDNPDVKTTIQLSG